MDGRAFDFGMSFGTSFTVIAFIVFSLSDISLHLGDGAFSRQHIVSNWRNSIGLG
jgi:hypothetical protein